MEFCPPRMKQKCREKNPESCFASRICSCGSVVIGALSPNTGLGQGTQVEILLPPLLLAVGASGPFLSRPLFLKYSLWTPLGHGGGVQKTMFPHDS
jgi:hypothetical protein